MIFNEIYSSYYNAVSNIIKEALQAPVNAEKIRETVLKYAFGESVLPIEQALKNQEWQLILPDGTTPLQNIPEIPLTLLQKRWLKAVSLDKRMKLFDIDMSFLDDTEPLFTQEDYYIFDRCNDGDDYDNETYISRFRMILSAVHSRKPLDITVRNRKNNEVSFIVMPEKLEYSEKDDKIRLLTSGSRAASVINLGRVVSCSLHEGEFKPEKGKRNSCRICSLTLELVDERNALERVMLHFSHFEKTAERLDEKHYRLTVRYEQSDETEMLIRVLSFGPLVRVTAPERFIKMIQKRLKRQKSCGL